MESRSAQFLQGFTAPWRGLRMVFVIDGGLRLALLPGILSLVFLTLAITAAFGTAVPATSWLIPGWEGSLLFSFTTGLVFILLAFGFGMLAYMVAALIAIPIHDQISERIEATLGNLPPPLSVREALPRSIAHSLSGVVLWASCVSGLALLQLLPAIGTVIGAIGSAFLSSFFLSHQLVDGPMSRRGWSFRAKMEWMHQHLPSLLGLGAAGSLVLFIPLIQLLALPVLVAGGAVLWVELFEGPRLTVQS